MGGGVTGRGDNDADDGDEAPIRYIPPSPATATSPVQLIAHEVQLLAHDHSTHAVQDRLNQLTVSKGVDVIPASSSARTHRHGEQWCLHPPGLMVPFAFFCEQLNGTCVRRHHGRTPLYIL